MKTTDTLSYGFPLLRLALAAVQHPLPQADALGGHLDKLVTANVANGVLQSELPGRCQVHLKPQKQASNDALFNHDPIN